MSRLLVGMLLATLAVAALGLWLRAGGSPEPALPPVSLPHPGAPAPAPRAPEAAVAAPEEPEPVANAAPPAPRLEVRPGAKRVVPAERAVSAAPPADPFPSLDQLLELPPAGPAVSQDVGWAGERGTEPAPDPRRRARRVRVDYSRENLVEGVPMQAERRRTDVGVSVSVDESDRLRVRGGVRVDEREASEEEREADQTPTVGVEVRF